MEMKSYTVSEALEELRDVLTRFDHQGPRAHLSEEDKVDYLYNAVVGQNWSKIVLKECYSSTPPWQFQQLYTSTDAAWLQDQKNKGNNTKGCVLLLS